MQTAQMSVECTNTIYNGHLLYNNVLMRYGDIAKRLLQRQKDAVKRLSEIHGKQDELRSAYRQYLDLDEDARRYEKRMARIIAALREQSEFENLSNTVKNGNSPSKTMGIAMNAEATPLWEIIVAILEETGELRVIELELLLKILNLETSRSAIESSFRAHPNEFRIRGDRHGKFVSLKGA